MKQFYQNVLLLSLLYFSELLGKYTSKVLQQIIYL